MGRAAVGLYAMWRLRARPPPDCCLTDTSKLQASRHLKVAWTSIVAAICVTLSRVCAGGLQDDVAFHERQGAVSARDPSRPRQRTPHHLGGGGSARSGAPTGAAPGQGVPGTRRDSIDLQEAWPAEQPSVADRPQGTSARPDPHEVRGLRPDAGRREAARGPRHHRWARDAAAVDAGRRPLGGSRAIAGSALASWSRSMARSTGGSRIAGRNAPCSSSSTTPPAG